MTQRGSATAAGFDRPLLLTPREDIVGYITGMIGRAVLFLLASASVLAVVGILGFIIYRSTLFLTTTDGDQQMTQRNIAAHKVALAFEQSLKQTGDPQAADRAAERLREEAEQVRQDVLEQTGDLGKALDAQSHRYQQAMLRDAGMEHRLVLEASNSPHEAQLVRRELYDEADQLHQQVVGTSGVDAKKRQLGEIENRASELRRTVTLYETGDRARARQARQAKVDQLAGDVYETYYNAKVADLRNKGISAEEAKQQAEEAALERKQNFLAAMNPSLMHELRNVGDRIEESLSSITWEPGHGTEPEFGMLALVYGSLLVTFGALLLAVPIGITVAVVLSDIVPFGIRQLFKPIIEILAAIPSVAFGFFAIMVVSPWMQEHLGFTTGNNALNASLILAVMAIPTIVSVAEDALTALGRELREASYSLGATRFETIFKVIIPAAHNGILAAVILGMMRAIGETMVVLMATGNAPQVPADWWNLTHLYENLSKSVATMTATIARGMGEAPEGSIFRSALFTVGMLLLIFTFVLNMITEYFTKRFRMAMGQEDKGASKSSPVANIGAALRTFFRWVWFIPGLLLGLVGRALGWAGGYVSRGLNLLIDPIRRPFRMNLDRAFTGFALGSVGLLVAALGVVLVPIFSKGLEAIVFKETVEHRIFIHDYFGRGDEAELQAEIRQCWKAREPVYDYLRQYAWLDPEPLASEVDALYRRTKEHLEQQVYRLESRRQQISTQLIRAEQDRDAEAVERLRKQEAELVRQLDERKRRNDDIESSARRLRKKLSDERRGGALQATEREAANRNLDYVIEWFEENDLLAGTPAERYEKIARDYKQSIAEANLELRDKDIHPHPDSGLPEQLDITYAEAYRDTRQIIAHMLGLQDRFDGEQHTVETTYGAAHWSMARKYRNSLVTATVMVPQFAPDGTPLLSKPVEVPRRYLFAGTSAAGFSDMFEYVDTHLEEMMQPRWKFYWRYFLDESTTGHFLGGVGPELLGTMLLTLVAILASLPLGVIAAAYLVEVAGDNVVVRTIRICINTLAGVPSIVFGLFGLAFFVNVLIGKPCVLAAGLTLGVLALPVIIRASEEAIRSVPRAYKEASLGLGAGRLRSFLTVTLPAALPGVLTGMILAMSRAAGETAPILFTGAQSAGSAVSGGDFLLDKTFALSYSSYYLATADDLAKLVPYNQYGMVTTLIMLVLILNLTAIVIRGRIARKLRGQ